jgi:hypothetical protein
MSVNLAFFGLQQKPFNPTPDPRFLYLSPGHREGLAQLLYGVQEHKGFIPGEMEREGRPPLLRTLLSRWTATPRQPSSSNDLRSEGLLGILRTLASRSWSRPAPHRPAQLPHRAPAPAGTVLILDGRRTSRPCLGGSAPLEFETETEKLLRSCSLAAERWTSWIVQAAIKAARIGLHPASDGRSDCDYITPAPDAGASDLRILLGGVTRIASIGRVRASSTRCDLPDDRLRRPDSADQPRHDGGESFFEQGERRPRKLRRPLHTWHRRLIRWGLPAAGAVLLGGVAALTIAHRSALQPVFDLSAATLSGLAHAASSFLRQ